MKQTKTQCKGKFWNEKWNSHRGFAMVLPVPVGAVYPTKIVSLRIKILLVKLRLRHAATEVETQTKKCLEWEGVTYGVAADHSMTSPSAFRANNEPPSALPRGPRSLIRWTPWNRCERRWIFDLHEKNRTCFFVMWVIHVQWLIWFAGS